MQAVTKTRRARASKSQRKLSRDKELTDTKRKQTKMRETSKIGYSTGKHACEAIKIPKKAHKSYRHDQARYARKLRQNKHIVKSDVTASRVMQLEPSQIDVSARATSHTLWCTQRTHNVYTTVGRGKINHAAINDTFDRTIKNSGTRSNGFC